MTEVGVAYLAMLAGVGTFGLSYAVVLFMSFPLVPGFLMSLGLGFVAVGTARHRLRAGRAEPDRAEGSA